MSRLDELLRQRALLEQHLAWLNREIAEATPPAPAGSAPAAAQPAPPPAPTSAAAATSPASAAAAAPSADVILEKYRVAPRSLEREVRQGCFLYFVVALILLALGVTALYFAVGSH